MINVYTTSKNVITKPTSIALGFFDGVHIGHHAVIQKAVDGKKEGLIPCVYTFTTHKLAPQQKKNAGMIFTETMKTKLMEDMGIACIVAPEFSDFSDMSPETFVKKILIENLHAKVITCGHDFHFGKGAKASALDLERYAMEQGVAVSIIPSVDMDGQVVSSTQIRKSLTEGDIRTANRLLGHLYTFDFVVAQGKKLGRTIQSPTINQYFEEECIIPKFGVYAAMVTVDGKEYPGVTNIGMKPTVGSDRPLAETYIIGFEGDLYGRRIMVGLFEYLREEKKFDSIEALSAEIQKNAVQASELFQSYKNRINSR